MRFVLLVTPLTLDLDRSDTTSHHTEYGLEFARLTVVLLILQIGPSALVGMSLFVLLTPLQTWFMKLSFIVRKKSIVCIQVAQAEALEMDSIVSAWIYGPNSRSALHPTQGDGRHTQDPHYPGRKPSHRIQCTCMSLLNS
jgi:hypothetical protein